MVRRRRFIDAEPAPPNPGTLHDAGATRFVIATVHVSPHDFGRCRTNRRTNSAIRTALCRCERRDPLRENSAQNRRGGLSTSRANAFRLPRYAGGHAAIYPIAVWLDGREHLSAAASISILPRRTTRSARQRREKAHLRPR